MNLVPVQTEDLRWDISLNYAQNKKYVDALAEGIERRVLDSWMSWGGLQTQEVVGEEWGLIVGRKKARDANGTQIVTETGRATFETNQVLGNLLPDFTGGLTSALAYKNWDFNV